MPAFRTFINYVRCITRLNAAAGKPHFVHGYCGYRDGVHRQDVGQTLYAGDAITMLLRLSGCVHSVDNYCICC